jgi:hypothetical protein
MKEKNNNRTTFFTSCNKNYQFFIPIFIHSILFHNNNCDIEVIVDDINLEENINTCIDFICSKYKESNVKIRIGDFNDINLNNKIYKKCPNVIRFIETPSIKNEFVYICDIDIIFLQQNIQDIHIIDMNKTKLNYSNIVRPYIDAENKRLTGLHFTKWNSYYPIPNFDDLIVKLYLNLDEVFLYNLVSKNNKISEKTTFRPVHGIHISLNREDPIEWGLKKWKTQWLNYRNSEEFKLIETYLSDRLLFFIEKIDSYYET